MTANHTPGPWSTDPRYFGNVYCDDATGSLVAKCGPFGFAPRPMVELAANTNLIAAAPDLLAALEALSPFFDLLVCYASTVDEHEPNRIVANALMAIAKAKGETP